MIKNSCAVYRLLAVCDVLPPPACELQEMYDYFQKREHFGRHSNVEAKIRRMDEITSPFYTSTNQREVVDEQAKEMLVIGRKRCQGVVAMHLRSHLLQGVTKRCLYDLKDGYGLKIEGLSVKCLPSADDQVFLWLSACEAMVTKIDDSVKKIDMKVKYLIVLDVRKAIAIAIKNEHNAVLKSMPDLFFGPDMDLGDDMSMDGFTKMGDDMDMTFPTMPTMTTDDVMKNECKDNKDCRMNKSYSSTSKVLKMVNGKVVTDKKDSLNIDNNNGISNRWSKQCELPWRRRSPSSVDTHDARGIISAFLAFRVEIGYLMEGEWGDGGFN
ncbi:hypothetical protein EVAR_66598_1 [Eumeta japonica]|uniref:Uncharacterized protein n=1 Tax=Eumeta variegata TaxID=151549 RepID=A0A4C1ZSV1_EUMVA|nr:hypothetical protein EVAR_66598_1 [Eumeta japonica]